MNADGPIEDISLKLALSSMLQYANARLPTSIACPSPTPKLIVFRDPQFMNAEGPIARPVVLLMLAVCRYAFPKKHCDGIDSVHEIAIDRRVQPPENAPSSMMAFWFPVKTTS